MEREEQAKAIAISLSWGIYGLAMEQVRSDASNNEDFAAIAIEFLAQTTRIPYNVHGINSQHRTKE